MEEFFAIWKQRIVEREAHNCKFCCSECADHCSGFGAFPDGVMGDSESSDED